MKWLKRGFKMILTIIITLLVILLLGGFFFIKLTPDFGARPTDHQKLAYAETGHYVEGKFINLIETKMDMNFKTVLGLLGEHIKGIPNSKPDFELPVEKIDSLEIVNHVAAQPKITWFGHSAILLEMGTKNILIDPMLTDAPSPHPWLGSKRYTDKLPIEIQKLPRIDAIILSHDHYDHLDYKSILQLKDKTDQFYTPLGVGNHLEKWGVAKEKIHELDWWEEIAFENILLACTPARHFSGRGIGDRNTTLWASWVIKSADYSIYFSGDSGYGPHFKEIGEKYGPFDFAMMECGQYDSRWEAIHMLPEQTAKAGDDVQAKTIMPIHWGAFTLAMHSWTDPVVRVTEAAKKYEYHITTPKIGEPVIVNSETYPESEWWVSKKVF